MFGLGMHFVPNLSLRWISAVSAMVYCGLLFAILLKIAPPRPPDISEKVPRSIKLAAGFPLFTYFIYVCFYMNLPAAYTQAFGSSARHEYQIEGVKKGGAKAVLCPYRLQLRGAVTVLDDTFCVSEKFALKQTPGQAISLTGKESILGFRFRNAS
jgi:hypothetical protein